LAASAAFALFALPSQAQTWDYNFGTWLANGYGYTGPSYQPTQTFASLSVSTTNRLSFDFTLKAFDPDGPGTLASAFGAGSFISKAVINSVSGQDPISISNIQTHGYVGNVFLGSSNVNVGGVAFDFYDSIGGSQCNQPGCNAPTLESGEWISWTLNFTNPQNPFLGDPPVALLVHGFDESGATQRWYTPMSPVPEPETYAMLLAGLGLMGFVARRRQLNLAVS